MPLYLIDVGPAPADAQDDAVRLAAKRFPEIAIEQRYFEHDGVRDLWVCRAPSAIHLERWTAAVGLPVHAIRLVDAAAVPTADPRAQQSAPTKEIR